MRQQIREGLKPSLFGTILKANHNKGALQYNLQKVVLITILKAKHNKSQEVSHYKQATMAAKQDCHSF